MKHPSVATRILLAVALLCVSSISSMGASVLIYSDDPADLPSPPAGLEGLGPVVGGNILNTPGGNISFGIYSTNGALPIDPLLGITGSHTVVVPGDFEMTFNSPLALVAGEYWLIAFVDRSGFGGSGATGPMGYVSIPFTLDESQIANGVLVTTGDNFSIQLQTSPIPEPSSLLLCCLASSALVLRRRA